MRAYRRLMISCVSTISNSVPPAAIISTPAACPAEVRLVSEMPTAAVAGSHNRTARIPNPKDTDRYPSAMGTP